MVISILDLADEKGIRTDSSTNVDGRISAIVEDLDVDGKMSVIAEEPDIDGKVSVESMSASSAEVW